MTINRAQRRGTCTQHPFRSVQVRSAAEDNLFLSLYVLYKRRICRISSAVRRAGVMLSLSAANSVRRCLFGKLYPSLSSFTAAAPPPPFIRHVFRESRLLPPAVHCRNNCRIRENICTVLASQLAEGRWRAYAVRPLSPLAAGCGCERDLVAPSVSPVSYPTTHTPVPESPIASSMS